MISRASEKIYTSKLDATTSINTGEGEHRGSEMISRTSEKMYTSKLDMTTSMNLSKGKGGSIR